MNGAVDDTSDQPEQKTDGPGARLKAAREAAGYDLARMAAQLHISPDQVAALENDSFDRFPARVFVRGYLRKYARLVQVSVDEVLAQFDAAWPEGRGSAPLKRVGSHRPQVGSGHGVVRAVSWALLLGIVVLFFVWWSGYLRDLDTDHGGAGTGDNAPAPSSAPPPVEAAPDGSLSLPPPAGDAPVSDEVQAPVAPTTVLPLPEQGGAEAVSELSQPVAADDAAPAGEAPSPVVPDLAPQVVLSLTGPCWVQIRDSSGSYRLVGEYKAGFREVLGGTPPYRINLGNASVATLTVDGQPVDLSAHQRGQVARLTLDPGAQ